MVDHSSSLCARRRLAQERLELGEQLLDRVEIRAVGRQVEDRGRGRGDRLADDHDLVRRQVVEHNDVAGRECGRQELLDVRAERRAVMGPSSTSGATMPLCRRPATSVVHWHGLRVPNLMDVLRT